MSVSLDTINPFPGLRAFEEHEDVYFFGREKQVDELLRKLRTNRFLAVIGSSGSGKSSLIKSGLIPSLHSGFMSGVSSAWHLCSFRPGTDPIGNLARALSAEGGLYNGSSGEDAHTFASITESILRRSSFGLVEACRQSELDNNTNLLILADQFEELFRFSRYEKEAGEGKRDSVTFINLLLKAVEQKELPLYVVFTMRSDFLGDCTAFRGLPEKINEGQYLVPRMSREEKKEAITGPVAVGGGKIAPGLLNMLLNDVGDNPDQLPILQHALMRTWDVWKKQDPGQARCLDIEDYEEAGTMRHALSQHAEEAYGELATPEKRKACEIMFKALTDREVDARGIRRPRTVAEIGELTHVSAEEVASIVEPFRKKGRGFLMPPEGVALHPSSVIDIAHESLMRVWSRLINWVEEEGQAAQVYMRLCEAADRYELGKAGLWRDPELQIALKWKEENDPDVIWASRYNNRFYKAILFLEHSKLQYDRERQHKEDMQKQRLRRAKKVAAVIFCVAVVAFLLAIYSLNQKNRATQLTKLAKRETNKADSLRRLALLHQKQAEENADAARKQKSMAEHNAQLAIDAKKEAEKEQANALASKLNAQKQTIIARHERTVADSNAQLAMKAQQNAEAETENAVRSKLEADSQFHISNRLRNLADARNHANQSILLLNEKKLSESQEEAVKAYTLNKDNGGPYQNNDVYHALSKNWSENAGHVVFSQHKFPVRSIAAAPNGNGLYSVDEAGMLYMLGNNHGVLQKLSQLDLKDEVRSLAIFPDGSNLLVLCAQGNGIVVSTAGNKMKEAGKITFPGVGKGVVFTGGGECVVFTSEGMGKYMLSANPQQIDFIHRPDIAAVCAGRVGFLFMASADTIYCYNSWKDIRAKPARTYRVAGKVTALDVDASGRYIAAGTAKGMIWLKDVNSGNYRTLPLHISPVNGLRFGETGSHLQLASAGADHIIKLVDVPSALSNGGEDILTLTGHSQWIYALSYSSDGQYIYSCGEDQKVIAWKTTLEGIYNALNILKN